MIYQHKIQGADRKIADALGAIIDEHKNVPAKDGNTRGTGTSEPPKRES